MAVYFAAQPGGLPVQSGERAPEPGHSLREADPAKRLIFAGGRSHCGAVLPGQLRANFGGAELRMGRGPRLAGCEFDAGNISRNDVSEQFE